MFGWRPFICLFSYVHGGKSIICFIFFSQVFERPLAEHMCSETDGHFRRLLTLIITGVRDESGDVDAAKASEDASALWAAGESKLGTDEEVFNRIMAHSSFEQLRLVFDEYKSLSGTTIEQAIEHEVDGDLKDALLAIGNCGNLFLNYNSPNLIIVCAVECVQSPAAFFAKCLHTAVDGSGTDEERLIRIIVSRAEIDLATIKDEYERIYNRTLLSAIKVIY